MPVIHKLRADHVIDHAAEELKKYLRMMMPECGEIAILYDPQATTGYRLGLLEDFGLPSEAEDPVVDDVIHVDTDGEGGILAGSNPRSVLFSVYRFLRENGCRWLYPGIDGDYVPTKEVGGIFYHKKADHRFRGFCNEGSESQTCMLEAADFYAKLEMNVYMLEWFIPNGYYNRYYSHLHNSTNRPPEPASDRQILQWKRQCEAEISKRGLMLHDVGHGWTCRPFGLPANNNATNDYSELAITEEQKSVLAMIGGKRELYQQVPIYTNLCMSQPKVRSAVARGVADYAQGHRNVDYLHVWLSDGARNHCECEACQALRPSDWYLMMLNEIDEELTRRALPTRIVFIAYLDTMFAPERVTLKHPERFSLLYAPISRRYTESVTDLKNLPEAAPYLRNAWKSPESVKEGFAHLQEWRKTWEGSVFSYEYHFWRHQFLDPGAMALARRLYEDVRSLRLMEMDGYVEDGSQRSAFPNAFPTYVYAAALMDRNVDFNALKEDYFSHAYGEDWKKAEGVLQEISDAFDFSYMEGECSEDPARSPYYAPSRQSRLHRLFSLAEEEKALAECHLAMEYRPQTVSYRLLWRHAEYVKLWAEILLEKALGNDKKAKELALRFESRFGKYEWELERYFDHSLSCRVLEHITKLPKGLILD